MSSFIYYSLQHNNIMVYNVQTASSVLGLLLHFIGAPILSSIHNGTTILLNGSADNSTISLDCSVTENPFQVVTWFQNGELVDEKWGINGNGTLQLTDSSDAELFGIYQCFASSPAGSSAILVRVLPLGM